MTREEARADFCRWLSDEGVCDEEEAGDAFDGYTVHLRAEIVALRKELDEALENIGLLGATLAADEQPHVLYHVALRLKKERNAAFALLGKHRDVTSDIDMRQYEADVDALLAGHVPAAPATPVQLAERPGLLPGDTVLAAMSTFNAADILRQIGDGQGEYVIGYDRLRSACNELLRLQTERNAALLQVTQERNERSCAEAERDVACERAQAAQTELARLAPGTPARMAPLWALVSVVEEACGNRAGRVHSSIDAIVRTTIETALAPSIPLLITGEMKIDLPGFGSMTGADLLADLNTLAMLQGSLAEIASERDKLAAECERLRVSFDPHAERDALLVRIATLHALLTEGLKLWSASDADWRSRVSAALRSGT